MDVQYWFCCNYYDNRNLACCYIIFWLVFIQLLLLYLVNSLFFQIFCVFFHLFRLFALPGEKRLREFVARTPRPVRPPVDRPLFFVKFEMVQLPVTVLLKGARWRGKLSASSFSVRVVISNSFRVIALLIYKWKNACIKELVFLEWLLFFSGGRSFRVKSMAVNTPLMTLIIAQSLK